jgi:hypothetical protein
MKSCKSGAANGGVEILSARPGSKSARKSRKLCAMIAMMATMIKAFECTVGFVVSSTAEISLGKSSDGFYHDARHARRDSDKFRGRR